MQSTPANATRGLKPFIALFYVSLCIVGRVDADDITIEYNRHIRPILSNTCFACHGPDSASRKADLRLDRRHDAVARGAISLGKPDASEMIRRIMSDDPDEQMPPPATKKILSAEQKKLLTRWIREGARYEPHWSLIAPQRQIVPTIANASWVRNPIDNFVGAELEARELQPSPEADKRTLARRLSLDLTGLPPTPELVTDFVNDNDPNAYERLVDKLLASPHWGEHRARYWLDAARYADTHGIHFDNYREMWSYRDWVINAFNSNMPFDQFTIENLAGDLLPNATLEQKIGSGFNRCNITTNEGGAIDEEYLVLYTRDRVETTAQVFMGLTAGCAVCHDHKFDPLSQREFYEMAAFFNNTVQRAMDDNLKDTSPIILVIPKKDQDRLKELQSKAEKLKTQVERLRHELRPAFDKWLAASPSRCMVQPPTNDLEFSAPLDDGGTTVSYVLRGKQIVHPLPSSAVFRDGRTGAKSSYSNGGPILIAPNAGNFERDQSFSVSMWLWLRNVDPRGAVLSRIDDEVEDLRGWDLWVENRRIGVHLSHCWPTNAIRVLTRAEIPAGRWVHVAMNYDGSSKAAGVQLFVNGRLQKLDVIVDLLSATIRNDAALVLGQRPRTATITDLGLQDVSIYGRVLTQSEIQALRDARLPAILAADNDKRSDGAVEALYEWWLSHYGGEYNTVNDQYATVEQHLSEIRTSGTVAHVMQEKSEPPHAYVLHRGQYDERRERVGPDTPAMLPPFPANAPRNRLGFARWLLMPEHPLTSRVTVNRFWSEVFGAGLVKTAGDLGVQGELPSHPELLDWLAVEFRESGWDVKHLFKLIVTSSTYRQQVLATPKKLEIDAENRLLSRGPRFRMDAEMVRDYVLCASRLLSDRIGGPSVRTYQPPGVWEAVAILNSNTRTYQQDAGDAVYRRSIYTFWKRAAPPASMDILNAPTREVCTVTRERTNTPLQALVTLNDPQFVEAARRLAEIVFRSAESTSERLQLVSERLLARRVSEQELAILQRSLAKYEPYYESNVDSAVKLINVGDSVPDSAIPPAKLAAWTMLANQMMNLDEVLNK